MTKARFQSALLLDADDTAFLLFAQAKGLGKSRADVIRKLISARRQQYQAGLNQWLLTPEGRGTIRAEGLEGLVGPIIPQISVDQEPEAAQDTGVTQVQEPVSCEPE